MKDLATAGCSAEIAERIGHLTAEDRAGWGIMQVSEMVQHLDGAYRMALGEEPVARAGSPLPRGMVKWMALWLPVKWPKSLPTVPELRRGTARVSGGEFLAGRAALLEVFGRFAAMGDLRTDHPIFGSMRTRDWMRWGYLHADHHLRQFGR